MTDQHDINSPTDLELATTDQLVEELARRYDTGFVFLRKNETERYERQRMVLRGDMFACLGMADYLKDEISCRIVAADEEHETDGDDTGD